MANAWIVSPLPIAAATSGNTAAGHSPIHVANDHMGVVWRANPNNATIVIDLGDDRSVDTALLLGLTGALPAWTYRVRAATQAQGPSFGSTVHVGSYDPVLAGASMPSNGRGKALWSSAAPITARYWEFSFGLTASDSAVIARVVLGRRIVLERNFRFGAAFGVRDLGTTDFSRRGVLLRARGAKLRTVGISFPHVRRDEVEGAVHPLIERVGASETVALITDPDPHAARQERIWFGPMVGDLGTVWARAGGFEWSVNLIDLDGVRP